MTTKEWIADSNKMLALINDAKFMMPVIQGTHNEQVQRVFDKGIAGDGAKIGDYSNEKTGLYINPKYNIGSFTPEGKTGEKVFKDGRPHKTKYFDNYKAYRTEIKKETGFVNLRLTEDLKTNYSNSLQFLNGRVVSGVSERNVGKLLRIIYGTKKLKGYGERVFELTKQEQENLNNKFGTSLLKNIRRD